MFLLIRNATQFLFCCTQPQTDHVTDLHNGLGYKNIINSRHKYNHQWMLLNNTQNYFQFESNFYSDTCSYNNMDSVYPN